MNGAKDILRRSEQSSKRHSLYLLPLLLMLYCSMGIAGQEIPIWTDQPAAWSRDNDVETYIAPCWGSDCAYDVTVPTLTLHIPPGSGNGNAVLVLPGGGYDVVAIFHEGVEIAEQLARDGTVAAVLKYRIPDPRTATHPERVPLSDVQQAMRILRERQATLGFHADRVGVMGFSAGAHLAVFAGQQASEPSVKPDFSMLIYGVTRLNDVNREWLESSLYHRAMTDAEIARQTLLDHVDATTPPAFIVHAQDDEICHYSESTLYADALMRHGVEVEMHLFPHGGHGFGRGREEDGTDQWLRLAASWLDRLGHDKARR